MRPYKIRKAAPGDLEAISILCQAHARFEGDCTTSFAGHVERLGEHLFRQPTGLSCLVVVFQSVIVGYTTFIKQFPTWDAAFYIYLDCLYLHPSVRQKGLGRALLENIRAAALAQGCNVIQWQTPSQNANAIHFYRKMGAKSKTKERFFWEVELTDSGSFSKSGKSETS